LFEYRAVLFNSLYADAPGNRALTTTLLAKKEERNASTIQGRIVIVVSYVQIITKEV